MNQGRVYLWTNPAAHPLGGSVRMASVPLPRLEADGRETPRLVGRFVRVRNAGVVHQPEPGGTGPRAVPIGDAQPNQAGDFLFEPQDGGERVDQGECLDATVRQRHIEAAHFGEVNAYFHLDRIAAYVSELLGELGAPLLPRVTAVVNAHHAATGTDDVGVGARRGVAFQGGHYRLPSWCYDVAEPDAISPDGEIHLGPGRRLMEHGALAQAAGRPYRHNASHNAGTLYHEYGHHLNRHTADFRANALRPAERQSNRKIATDEGTCDYWVATMLGTPHIWSWHHRHDSEVVHRRSLVSRKTMAEYDGGPDADPHANGTIWAAALWDLRTRLAAAEPDGARQTDRLVLQTLLLIGQRFGDEPLPTVAGVCRAREGFAVALAALLEAEDRLHAGRFREAILAVFAARGIHLETNAARPAQALTR